MMTSYLTYNNFTQTFLRVKKLTYKDYLDIKESLLERFVAKEDCEFNLEEYVLVVLNSVLSDFGEIVEKTNGVVLEDQTTLNALFDSVQDIYPELGVEIFCASFNEFVDENDAEGEAKPLRNSRKVEDTTLHLSSLENIDSILKVKNHLQTRIVGQDTAVEEVIDSLKLVTTGFSKHLSLFFIGTTGTGKTELSKALAESLYGNEDKLVKINCGEYASNHEYAKLIGSPPGYVGHGEKNIFRSKSEKSNSWVICFDEIEKANKSLLNVLLNLLDEGKVRDSTGYECDFSNSIFIFTSNVGISKYVGKSGIGFGVGESTFEMVRESVNKEIDNEFPAEFRNRIDRWVYFNTLTNEDAMKIAALNLHSHGLKVGVSILRYIAKSSYSILYGARNIKRFITSNILLKVADSVLEVGLDKREDYNFKVSLKAGEINILPVKKRAKSKQQESD